MVDIFCVNDGRHYPVEEGYMIAALAPEKVTDPKTGKEYPVLAALVDHKLKSLDTKVFEPHQIEYVGFNHPDGRRTYIRSLSFLAQRAVRNLFPDKVFKINHSLPSGMYCKFRACRITDEEIKQLKEEMRRLVQLDLPFTREKMLATDAEAIYEAQNQHLKAGLQRSLGRYSCSVYFLDGVADTF